MTAKELLAVKGLNENVQLLLSRLLQYEPTLKDLSNEQLDTVAKAVIFDDLKAELQKEKLFAKIDYEAEKAMFLNSSKTGSLYTKRSYANALAKLEHYCPRVLELTPMSADQWILHLRQEGFSPASVRQYVAVASAFFTFLERHFPEIKNPFRGTKARPAKKTSRPCQYPTKQEVKLLIEAMSPELSAMAFIMVKRGLRVGAFQSLSIRGNVFTTTTKGKELTGELPPECVQRVKDLNLPLSSPFAKWSTDTIRRTFRYYAEKLYKAGKIAAIYSPHDLRHYFAVTEYQKNKDIHKLSKLLGHNSIAITETYLRGLKVIV